MVHGRKDLSSCWTPCFWHNNVRDGSLAVAVYTFFMSLAVVTYCVYIMTGGDTSQLWLPFFETDLKDTLQGKSLCPPLQRISKECFPGCVKLGEKLRFVYLLQAGERNFFTPYSHNLGRFF